MVKGGRTQCARPDVGGGLPQRNTTALRMITSFIIPYWDWQARNRFWGHLSEMPVYRASEATTIRKTLADLSVQTGVGERIGVLPLVARVARESTEKTNSPKSRWRRDAIRIPPAADASAATVADRAPAQVAVRTFIVRINESGFRNQESRNSHLTSIDNPLPYGCG